jgi:hypothetical protein
LDESQKGSDPAVEHREGELSDPRADVLTELADSLTAEMYFSHTPMTHAPTTDNR